jgi:energy-coupling factor transporter ATP-binding protein EcfA2
MVPGISYADSDPVQPVILPWEPFQVMFYQAHKQGEHIAIVGPSGSGKTVLGLELCKVIGSRMAVDRRPSRVTVIQTKKRDDTTRMVLPEKEWPIIKKWPPSYGQEHVIVWPRGGPPSTVARRQHNILLPLVDTIADEGSQTLYLPEAAYFERPLPKGLGMAPTMENIWSMSRSSKLTMISDTQRPRQVTRLMWSEPQWVCVYPPDDEDDLKRIAELSGFKREVFIISRQLGEHEFLCIRRQRHGGKRELYVSRVEGYA